MKLGDTHITPWDRLWAVRASNKLPEAHTAPPFFRIVIGNTNTLLAYLIKLDDFYIDTLGNNLDSVILLLLLLDWVMIVHVKLIYLRRV